MADGTTPTLVSKDSDANAAANPIFTQLSDGTNPIGTTGGSLDVNITGGASAGAQYAEDSAAVSGDMGTMALAVRQDTLSSSVSADGDYGWLKFDSIGRLWVNVNNTVTVSATDLDIRDLAFATDKVDVSGSTVTVTATNLDIRDLAFATDKVDVSGSSVTVSATDLDIRDLNLTQDAVRISGNTSANSITNPIFVQLTHNAVTGEVNSYSTATPAGGATSNHDYTVTSTMKLTAIDYACSGPMKIEVQVGPVASLVTKAVRFVPNAGGGGQIQFDPPIEVPSTSTGTVRVIRTNRANQSMDVYSTILGIDN